jgi:hypothetical protein
VFVSAADELEEQVRSVLLEGQVADLVDVIEDAISGLQPHHLEEAGRMGVLHAPTDRTIETIAMLAAAGQR